MMPRNGTSHMHSYGKVGINMTPSRWIFRIISPSSKTVIPITARKLCTSWTSTARLMLPKLPNLRAPPLHKGAEEEVDVAERVVMEKAMTISIRNTSRIRLVTNVRRRGTLQTSALRIQTMMMTKNLWRAPLAVSRSSRRTSSL
jgi:hypothetical protein